MAQNQKALEAAAEKTGHTLENFVALLLATDKLDHKEMFVFTASVKSACVEAASLITAQASALAEYKTALSDPTAVHSNMLRGTIAKPSIRSMLHLHGAEALQKWDDAEASESALAEARERIAELESKLEDETLNHAYDNYGTHES